MQCRKRVVMLLYLSVVIHFIIIILILCDFIVEGETYRDSNFNHKPGELKLPEALLLAWNCSLQRGL